MDITNLVNSGNNNEVDEINESDKLIHIRVQKRNGRKCMTIIENVSSINNNKNFTRDLSKSLRKKYNCMATVKDDSIVLSGDHRNNVMKYLIDEELITEESIKLHGF